jgi:hypothetical protein
MGRDRQAECLDAVGGFSPCLGREGAGTDRFLLKKGDQFRNKAGSTIDPGWLTPKNNDRSSQLPREIGMSARAIPQEQVQKLGAELLQAAGGFGRALYWYGSYPAGEAVYGSDVDIAVVVRDEVTDSVLSEIPRSVASHAAKIPVLVDLLICLEGDLVRLGTPWLHTQAVCLAGVDIRDCLSRVPTKAYTDRFIHHVWELVNGSRTLNQQQIPLPSLLPARDPDDPFWGYLDRQMKGPGGQLVPSTQGLVSLVLKLANGMIGLQTGLIRSSSQAELRAECQQVLQPIWANLVEQIVELCRTQWEYRVPKNELDLHKIQSFCPQILAMETEFLRMCSHRV